MTHLTEMYSRSDAFPDCLRLLLERGAVLDDPRLAPVLLDDADMLTAALRKDPALIHHRTTMASTFTPLDGASLLHVAAEYGNANAVRVLIEAGADVNARAAVDAHGLNGHTPLFHTVNSAWNRSAPILEALLDAGAAPHPTARITWVAGSNGRDVLDDATRRAVRPPAAGTPRRAGHLREHPPPADSLEPQRAAARQRAESLPQAEPVTPRVPRVSYRPAERRTVSCPI